MLEIHDRLGSISAASGRGVQQHAKLVNRNQSLHDVNRQGKSNAPNQILVIKNHFTKLAEAAPCQTASAEETCDHLITHWISRYGFPMTFQSDNGKAFVGDLTKELMKRSHIAQAHSTIYHS